MRTVDLLWHLDARYRTVWCAWVVCHSSIVVPIVDETCLNQAVAAGIVFG